MKLSAYFLLSSLSLILFACGSPQPADNQSVTTSSETPVTAPNFDADSAFYFVEKQVAFGARTPGSQAHENCAKWLAQRLSAYADTVIVQPFSAKAWNGETHQGKNIIASFNLEKPARILLGAHWDSRPNADHDPDSNHWRKPVLGANDGASGVGTLMEIARQLSLKKPNVGIDIIFFDLEDNGTPEFADNQSNTMHTWALGAQHWSQNPHKLNYRANYGILLDMVGTKNPRFAKEGVSMYFAADIVRKVWNTAQTLGFSHTFVGDQTGEILDDHYFVNQFARIPMINIIHYDPRTETRFFPQWHTVSDDLNYVEMSTLRMVGQVVLAQIYQEK